MIVESWVMIRGFSFAGALEGAVQTKDKENTEAF